MVEESTAETISERSFVLFICVGDTNEEEEEEEEKLPTKLLQSTMEEGKLVEENGCSKLSKSSVTNLRPVWKFNSISGE